MSSSSFNYSLDLFFENEFDLFLDVGNESFMVIFGCPANRACPVSVAASIGSEESEELYLLSASNLE